MNSARILVRTSNDTLASIITYRLELLGATAVRIGASDQLESIIANAVPQLVIIDLDNSDGSGIAFVEKLSVDIRTCNLSILCLSAEGDLALAETAYRTGAHDFLVVPFDMLLLEQKVRKLLTLTETQRTKSVATAATV